MSGALEAVDRILNRGGDADDVLRQVVAVVHERGPFEWVGLTFVEGEGTLDGPSAGAGDAGRAEAFPVAYEGARVAELRAAPVAGDDDRALLARVATLISPYCLVGWDTGGQAWEP